MQMNLKGNLFLIPFFSPSPLLSFLFGTVQEQTFEYHLWLNSPIGGALYWLKKYTRVWEVTCVNFSPPVSSDFTLYNPAPLWTLAAPERQLWHILKDALLQLSNLSASHDLTRSSICCPTRSGSWASTILFHAWRWEDLANCNICFPMIWYLIVGSDSLLINITNIVLRCLSKTTIYLENLATRDHPYLLGNALLFYSLLMHSSWDSGHRHVKFDKCNAGYHCLNGKGWSCPCIIFTIRKKYQSS